MLISGSTHFSSSLNKLTANGAGEIQPEVLAQGPHSELLKEDDGFPEERTNL